MHICEIYCKSVMNLNIVLCVTNVCKFFVVKCELFHDNLKEMITIYKTNTVLQIHYMEKSIGTYNHYNNRDFNDIAL